MKTLINCKSVKRLRAFNMLQLLLSVLFIVSMYSCQKIENERYSVNVLSNSTLSTQSLTKTTQTTSYFHQYLSIGPSLIAEAHNTIEDNLYENFEKNSFALKVQNGWSGGSKVLSIEIKLNNKLILSTSDFKKGDFVIRGLSSFTNPAQLDIKIEGPDGSSIYIWIDGILIQGKVKDADGNIYRTVKIGTQWWLTENLKATHFNDGTPIEYETDNNTWRSLTVGGYCYLDNDINNKDVFGALYNYYAVETDNLCPTGWHVPSNEEWTTLVNYLGGENYAGEKLKEAGTSHWQSDYAGVTNESGFTALPGGCRQSVDGAGFYGNRYMGRWWTSTSPSEGIVLNKTILDFMNAVLTDWHMKMEGFSVRCIKDNKPNQH